MAFELKLVVLALVAPQYVDIDHDDLTSVLANLGGYINPMSLTKAECLDAAAGFLDGFKKNAKSYMANLSEPFSNRIEYHDTIQIVQSYLDRIDSADRAGYLALIGERWDRMHAYR
jgi:hypothetical protein